MYSDRFTVDAGVRQGGILSPLLFNVFIDSLIDKLQQSGHGICIGKNFFGCIVYADDILIISKTICGLQCMLDICSKMADVLNIKFNTDKSMALRIGPRWHVKTHSVTLCGAVIKFVDQIKILEIIVKSGRH